MCWWVEVVEVMKIWKKEGGIWLLWQMFENPKVACANGGLHRYLCKWWGYYTCRQTNLMLWSCSISLAIWYTPSSHKDDILQLMVSARNCHSHFWWGSCWDLKSPVARKIEKQFVRRASNSKHSLFLWGAGGCFQLGEAYQVTLKISKRWVGDACENLKVYHIDPMLYSGGLSGQENLQGFSSQVFVALMGSMSEVLTTMLRLCFLYN